MEIEEIRDTMRKAGVEEAFFYNWERYHLSRIEDSKSFFRQFSRRTFSKNFSRETVSFYWENTPQKHYFWLGVQMMLIYQNMDREIRLAKQAMLLLRKLGWTARYEKSSMIESIIRTLYRIRPEQIIVAYCVKCLESNKDSMMADDKEYIRNAVSFFKASMVFQEPDDYGSDGYSYYRCKEGV